MGEGLVRAMAEVPAPFFEADYDLGRCAEVQESLAAREADAGRAVSVNLLLQERLSHYLDIVEIHLLQEIGTRSDSFFQALAVLNDLGGLMHKVRRS
jgi:vacuolar protein sorting-associated protein 54